MNEPIHEAKPARLMTQLVGNKLPTLRLARKLRGPWPGDQEAGNDCHQGHGPHDDRAGWQIQHGGQHDVVVPEADESTCQRYYDKHPGSFFDKESGQRLTFDRAKAYIRDYLHSKAMRIAVAEYIKALSCDADIEGIELVGSEITLPE